MFSIALAGEAVASSTQNSILSFLPLVVLVFVFYFFIIRPQQKRSKQEGEMRKGLRIGDKIVTTSGIFGSITNIDDEKNVVSIEVAKGVNITIYKASVAETLTQKPQTENEAKK